MVSEKFHFEIYVPEAILDVQEAILDVQEAILDVPEVILGPA